MKFKPIHIAFFLFLTLGGLLGISFLSSTLSDDTEAIAIGDFTLKYPTTATLLGLNKDSFTTNTKVNKVLEAVKNNITPLEIEPAKDSITLEAKNNELAAPNINQIDSTAIQPIAFPDSTFIEQLQRKLRSNSCRIIHYGDSQLEGDRITGYLRNRLQKIYGGGGPGFIPIKQVYHQISAVVTPSDHWERYALFDPTQEKFSHKQYGAYLSLSRFTPLVSDSTNTDSITSTKAQISISPSKQTYRKFRSYNHIALHYGNATTKTSIKVLHNQEVIHTDSLIADGKYHTYSYKKPNHIKEVTFELESKVSPDFYGLTLDHGRGIQIDNVAMRGASGTHFSKNNRANFKQMLKGLDPEIIIMQYGGNTVPYLKDSLAVKRYAKQIKWQINNLKRMKPGIQFLFIGPTDLCKSINGKMTTYPLLPYLNQQLKQTCLDNQTAYWDMFNAMGGEGAMNVWVDNGYAGKDYVHFTPKGTKYISELFFISLYLDLVKK